MFTTTAEYLADLFARAASGWNRFWFTPSDPTVVSLLRIGCGLSAVAYLLSHSIDLVTWFGPHGLLPANVVRSLESTPTELVSGYHWSYLNYADEASLLWVLHGAGVLIAAAFTAGLYSRITSCLTLFVVLSYVHRAPMLTGPWEPILTMALLYLCLAPSGACWSFDQLLRKRASVAGEANSAPPSTMATVATRLMQVHVAALCFAMGLAKVAGDTWWLGEAVWWLIAHTESRLVDLSFLSEAFLLVNLWSHAIVLFELGFPLTIWIRPLRPLLLLVAMAHWSLLALLTGQLGFCCTMVVVSLCYIDRQHLDRLGLR